MYLNNIDFPNQILNAIQDNKLVIFAGAGASVDKPTSLPDFIDLAKRIAEDTGKTFNNKNMSCEVFLGDLKACGVDVNEITAHILSGSCLKHNALHEAIVDLFDSPDNIKIVTTNYDQMFEQVLEEKSVTVPIYNSPALPLGNDISGIVHIHGNVSNAKYMVLTDEDFGRAYLTEGYVSRFLVRLFESYTVLFVGYSYKDTILRYLTRAMSREHSANRYILTSDTKSNWTSLGITAIYFPKRSYAVMRNGLIKLGSYAKKGLWDWRNQFIENADNPPKDKTIETEIDYCLEDLERSKVLSSCLHGARWLEYLDSKNLFSCCFSNSTFVNNNDRVWAEWLSNGFVGKDDQSLINLFAKHGNRFSDFFSKDILRMLISQNRYLNDDYFKQYITLLDQCVFEPWIIFKLIEIANERHLNDLSLHLFKKLFRVSIKLEKNNWINAEKFSPKHSLPGDYHLVKHTWDQINKEILPYYAAEIMCFVKDTIEEIHYMYSEMGYASDEKEPWSMSMLVVEDREKEYSKNTLHVLAQAFLQAAQALGESEDSRFYLKKALCSKSILLRKIALRAIRESNCFSDDEKIGLICDESFVWFLEGREQVFLLANEAFKKASSKNQNKLLDIIKKGPIYLEDDRDIQNAIYNWYVWLQKTDSKNVRLKSAIDLILSKYDFCPREHPELIIVEGDSVWVEDKSPLTTHEMLEMPIEKLATMLLNYNENIDNGTTKYGLQKTFSECIKENLKWARRITDYFCKQKINDETIWNCLFRGLEEADLSIDEALSWCSECLKIIEVLSDVHVIAHYLLNVLQNKEIRQKFIENEKEMFALSLKIWNKRNINKPSLMRIIDRVFNTTTGIVLLCWIYMISYSDNTEISISYITMLEEALKLKYWEREVVVCVLAGHFNFLCYRNKSWCVNHFEPILIGKNKREYISAWEGITYFSGSINKDTADIIAPIYYKAVKNICWLKDEARIGFIELYLTLLIFVVDKPTLRYIPEFYKNTTDEIRNQFIESIGHRLRKMDLESKTNWWNSWLKRFLENRKSNKPLVLSESECSSLFELLPNLSFVFDDAVKILCKGSVPSSINDLFWYELSDKKLAFEYPNSIAELLIKLLSSIDNIGYGDVYLIEVIKQLHGLKMNEQKQLQELLLKHSIDVLI